MSFTIRTSAKLSVLLLTAAVATVSAQQVAEKTATTYETKLDIPYRTDSEPTEYMRERCRLDLYYPTNKRAYSTIVWFHGGGLTGGNKSVPKRLKGEGVAVAAVNYRLYPKIKSPVYIEDAAASVAWIIKNIADFGGDPKRVFVSGHSAGGYLTSMVGLDKSYLAKHNIDANQIAGLIPYSGHTITHFTVRTERGIEGTQPIVDNMAPLFHVRKDAPPILFVTGDRDLEMLGRYEENAYLWRMIRVVKHPNAELHELQGYNHGQMAEPAHPLMLRFVSKFSK